MKAIWLLAGRLIYWFGWPVSFVMLFFSRRARVLIVHKGDILLVKNWMGNGDLHSPGGGLRKGEEPPTGAARELNEELGISVKSGDLHPLFEKRAVTRRHFRYYCYAFLLELPTKPDLKLDTKEIIAAQWLPAAQVKLNNLGGPILQDMLSAWEQHRKM